MSHLQENDDVLKHALETTSRCWEHFPHLTDPDFIADFTQCLHWRYEGNPSEEAMNSYLKEFELPEVYLYDILANRFPLWLAAQSLLFNRICETATGHRHICLIDLGSGRGEQLVRILHSLNRVNGLQTVTVISAELQSSSLEFCTSYIRTVSRRFQYTLHVKSLPGRVEELTTDTIKAEMPGQYDVLIINASLVLHHVQQMNERQRLFNTLHALEPALLTLAEPDTDCFTADAELRIQDAFEHFGSIYSYIDSLSVKPAEKKGLKQFFRNELYDTLVLPDTHRFEKYLPGTQWMEQAVAAGFVPARMPSLNILPETPGIDAAEMSPGYIRFTFKGSGLLAVMGLE